MEHAMENGDRPVCVQVGADLRPGAERRKSISEEATSVRQGPASQPVDLQVASDVRAGAERTKSMSEKPQALSREIPARA